MAASSANSASGMCRNSSRSMASWAFSLSRWLETETNSPRAIETAPPTRAASPAVKIGPRSWVAPATPTTMPATETMPSLAPNTAAQPIQPTSAVTGVRLGGMCWLLTCRGIYLLVRRLQRLLWSVLIVVHVAKPSAYSSVEPASPASPNFRPTDIISLALATVKGVMITLARTRGMPIPARRTDPRNGARGTSMTVIHGLPAHVLFVHFLVVLAPLTALLVIACGLWPAARRGHLVWLTVVLAAVTTVLTPITTHAGGWLYDLRRNPDPILRKHAELGDTMIYFAVALLIVAIGLLLLGLAERRSGSRRPAIKVTVAVVAIAVGTAAIIQTYRIGDAGAQSVWGNEIAHLQQTKPK